MRILPALLLMLALAAPREAGAADAATGEAAVPGPGKELFETHCGACHSLDLPRSQRLDRANWKWVIDDMVNQFGATWLTEEQQKLILEYVVETYGPDAPRAN